MDLVIIVVSFVVRLVGLILVGIGMDDDVVLMVFVVMLSLDIVSKCSLIYLMGCSFLGLLYV